VQEWCALCRSRVGGQRVMGVHRRSRTMGSVIVRTLNNTATYIA